MKLKTFEKEVTILFEMSDDDDFYEIFCKLKNAVKAEGFRSIAKSKDYFEGKNHKDIEVKDYFFTQKTELPIDWVSHDGMNYFRVKIMDKERFYKFLQKFCEENGITFEIPVETPIKIDWSEIVKTKEFRDNLRVRMKDFDSQDNL